MARRLPRWTAALYTMAWLALLALMPWWLGLPILLALAAAAALLQQRLAQRHATVIRHALRWGLPGWLLALQHALGGDAFAWGAALLGALSGYTLLAGLEAWLDRDLRRATSAPVADWSELARAPIGPPAKIIELLPPAWHAAPGEVADPLGGVVHVAADGCRFADGARVDVPNGSGGFAQVAFSPDGRWFAARIRGRPVLLLWDRQRDRGHRLRGWQLSGWQRDQPWLSRREGAMPLALSAVLGRDADEPFL